MGQVTQFFQPPLYWQQFEELTASVLNEVYQPKLVSKIGRPGQAQHGVDVHARTERYGHVGVQCKRLDDLDDNNQPYPGGPITAKLLREEADKALSFLPRLDLFIVATTAKRDAVTQRHARQLDEQHHRKGCFAVQVWFWDDYVTWLNHFTDLQRWYYSQVINVQSPEDQDRLILDLVATAFDRPAFRDAIHTEHMDDFLQALRDTQAALRTGELVNRETRHVIKKAVGGWRAVSNTEWKRQLLDLEEELRKLRGMLVEGIKDRRISKRYGYLDIRDAALGEELNARRQRCVDQLNHLLGCAGLQPLRSLP